MTASLEIDSVPMVDGECSRELLLKGVSLGLDTRSGTGGFE